MTKWRRFWQERLPLHLVIGRVFFVPAQLNIWYVFGALLMLSLGLQVLTGFWLTLFYQPSAENAFASVQYLMRQVPYGWLLRNLHTTGASALFVLLYLHMFRGILYRSYQSPREVVWLLGVLLFVVMLAEAFSGYLLPWGQMSYWGATVVTDMLSGLPWGNTLVLWIRGDYSVSGVTLQRFYALHIMALPLLLLWVVRLHIKALHHVGSGNPTGQTIDTRAVNGVPPAGCVAFYPQQAYQDMVAWLWYLLIFCAVVFFVPRGWGFLIDRLNEQLANPWQTPTEIRPLWYMAPFYALLRAIPSKAGGLWAMIGSLVLLALLPWFGAWRARLGWRSLKYRVLLLCLVVLCFFGLTVMGLITLQAWCAPLTLGFVIIGVVALGLAL